METIEAKSCGYVLPVDTQHHCVAGDSDSASTTSVTDLSGCQKSGITAAAMGIICCIEGTL